MAIDTANLMGVKTKSSIRRNTRNWECGTALSFGLLQNSRLRKTAENFTARNASRRSTLSVDTRIDIPVLIVLRTASATLSHIATSKSIDTSLNEKREYIQ